MEQSLETLSGSKIAPTHAERDALFRDFAKALFRGDTDALYRVVVPGFQWNYHDGVSVTKCLVGAEAIRAHMAEQKAMFSAQRYHTVSYYHLPQITFMTFQVSETVSASGARREQYGVECYTFEMVRSQPRMYRKPSVKSGLGRETAVKKNVFVFES